MQEAPNRTKRLFSNAPATSDVIAEPVESLRVCLYLVDREGVIQQKLGTVDDQAIHKAQGSSVFDQLPENLRPRLRKRLQETFESATARGMHFSVTAPGGGERIHEVRLSPFAPNGKTDSAVIAILDVTDTVSALRQARERNEELRAVFETLPDTYFRVRPDGTIVDYRAQKASDLYLPPEHFLGRRIQELLPEHVGHLWEKNSERLVRGETDVAYEYELDLPAGRQVFESRLSALPRSNDIIAVVRNITDRRRAETQLLEFNQRLEEAQSIAHLGSWTFDVDANQAAWSPETYRIFGVDSALFVPSIESIGQCIHPEDRQSYANQVAVWLSGTETEPIDLRILRPDGVERILSARCKPLRNSNDRVVQLAGTVQDVTEPRRMEQELKSSEQRFRALIDNSADAIALVTRHGIVTYASSSSCRVMGYTPDDLLGLSLIELVTPELRDAIRASLSCALKSPGVPVAVDTEAMRKDGKPIRLDGHFTNLLDLAGVNAVVFNYRDVTEREHQREALERAHQEADMFRRMVELATQAIGTADLEARVLYQNPALLRLLGVPSLEAAQKHTYDDFYREEDLTYLRQEVIPAVLAEGHWIGEMTVKPLCREPVATIHNIYLVRDDAGQPVMISNVVTDISRQKAIEQALRTSESKYRQLFEEAMDGIAVADIETGELIDCNPALCRMVGRSREELIGQSQRILHRPEETIGEVSSTFEAHRSGGQGKIMDSQLISAAGKTVDVEIMANVVELEGRRALQAVFRDVMEKKRAAEALFEEKERAQVTLHCIGDAVITTDDGCRVDYLNPVAEKLTGWSRGEASGRRLDEVFQIHEDSSGEPVDNLVARCMREGRVIDLARNIVLRGRDGKEYDIDESAAPIRRADGRILGAVLVFHDITETRRLARKMAYDAAHDPLTGLINRREFEIRLGRALDSAQKYGSRHALCYIDLDQFKIVNDTAGHEAGDVLLKQIKNLLGNTFREHDTLARLGGDEFGLLLDNCPLERAMAIASEIVNSIRGYRFVWQGRGFQVGASVGIAPITRNTDSIARLLSHADVACYTAKELGRNRVHVYHEEEGVSVQRHVEILQAAGLRDALEMDRFRLFCQPIIPLRGGEHNDATRFELLLRLEDDDGKLVLPGVFIPAAERFDLMTDLDRWVIRTAFQSYGEVLGHRAAQISVNLSGNSLNDSSLLDYVSRQFEEYSLPPDRVCFEITETAAVNDLSRAGQFMFEVHALGCQLALDDFGNGLSSLRYLKMLPVDFLKIDGGFVQCVDEDSGDQAIVSAVNQLAHNLGIRTIGEYAATERIVKTLHSLGVDYAQGFALGHPVPFTPSGISLLKEDRFLSGSN